MQKPHELYSMKNSQGNGTSLKVGKSGQTALVKIDGLWVHRGSMRPAADWDRVVDNIRNERIASVSLCVIQSASAQLRFHQPKP